MWKLTTPLRLHFYKVLRKTVTTWTPITAHKLVEYFVKHSLNVIQKDSCCNWSSSMTFFFVCNFFVVRLKIENIRDSVQRGRKKRKTKKVSFVCLFVFLNLNSSLKMRLFSKATTWKKEGLQNLFNLLFSKYKHVNRWRSSPHFHCLFQKGKEA